MSDPLHHLSRRFSAGYDSSTLDDSIGQLSYLADDNGSGGMGTHLEEYSYLGLSTVVARNHPQSGVNLTYIGTGTGDAGDHYTGLDRFGRVVNQNWANGAGTSLDKYTYTYDRDSNRTAKANALSSALDEAYTYDGLNRLSAATRNGSAYQAWDLDATGNWDSVTTSGTTDTRTHNAQNQITQAQGNTLAFDANGNTIIGQTGTHFGYDAWNRLVSSWLPQGGGIVLPLTSFEYDALGRQISKVFNAGPVTHQFYSSMGQVAEEQYDDGTVVEQYVWSPVYVNALIERDQGSQRLYVAQDANWNVTALIGTDGQVKQRYQYDAYGVQTVLAVNWTSASDAYGLLYGYQGGRADPATGLIHFQARDYNPALGTWMQPDAEGYIDGMSRYQFVRGNPINLIDPAGLAAGGGIILPHPNSPNWGPIDPETGQPRWMPKIPGGWKPVRPSEPYDPSDPESRPGKWVPADPKANRGSKGSLPSGSWDPVPSPECPNGHGDYDDGRGNRQHLDENGNPISPEVAHPKSDDPGDTNSGYGDANRTWWQRIWDWIYVHAPGVPEINPNTGLPYAPYPDMPWMPGGIGEPMPGGIPIME